MMLATSIKTQLLYAFWQCATRIGLRKCGNCLQTWSPFSKCYEDSLFCVEMGDADDDNDSKHASIKYIALTIDDGLCRPVNDNEEENNNNNNNNPSMVHDVCQLLERYQHAKATFFVCTEYTQPEDAIVLLSQGHELGNHLRRDVSNFYCNLSQADFERELLETNQYLEELLQEYNSKRGTVTRQNQQKQQQEQDRIKWFRAPQGRMSVAMKDVLLQHGMINVMGDCYCDDWFFMEALDATNDAQTTNREVERVANLLMRQVQPGSVAIFHMPQRNFREAGILVLEKFLEQCQRRQIQCITLSELVGLGQRRITESAAQHRKRD